MNLIKRKLLGSQPVNNKLHVCVLVSAVTDTHP